MINEDIPGVEVAVQVDGADVNEFDAPDAGDEDEASATLTKYIECVDDAFFTIRVRMGDYDWDEVPHCLHTSIFVDGQWIAGRIFRPGGMPVAQIKGREDHCVGEGWVLRKLRFAAVKTGKGSPKMGGLRLQRMYAD